MPFLATKARREFRHGLTQINADELSHRERGGFQPALASLSESLFDASIYRSFVLSHRVPSKPDPVCEAGEKGGLLTTDCTPREITLRYLTG